MTEIDKTPTERLIRALRLNLNAEARDAIAAGADVNYRVHVADAPSYPVYWPMLWLAIASGSEENVRLLLENQVDLCAVDSNDRSAVMACVQEAPDPRILKMLIAAGADVNREAMSGQNPLDAAIVNFGFKRRALDPEARERLRSEHGEVIQALLDAGASSKKISTNERLAEYKRAIGGAEEGLNA